MELKRIIRIIEFFKVISIEVRELIAWTGMSPSGSKRNVRKNQISLPNLALLKFNHWLNTKQSKNYCFFSSVRGNNKDAMRKNSAFICICAHFCLNFTLNSTERRTLNPISICKLGCSVYKDMRIKCYLTAYLGEF